MFNVPFSNLTETLKLSPAVSGIIPRFCSSPQPGVTVTLISSHTTSSGIKITGSPGITFGTIISPVI